MNKPNTFAAFLAYLLLVIGWLYVFLFCRRDELAMYHAKQSIMLVVAATGGTILWAVLAWVVLFIPLAGPLVSASSFSLVIALYLTLLIDWVLGMIYALQARYVPLPIIGGLAQRYLSA